MIADIYKTQQERGLPRYDAITEPWHHQSLRFVCDDCGRQLRPGYVQGFRWPEEPVPTPLRGIAWNQIVSIGRTLCRDCCREYVKTSGITDPEEIKRIMP